VDARRVLALLAFVGVAPCWNKLALRKKLSFYMPSPNLLAFVVSEISAFIRTKRLGYGWIDSASDPDQDIASFYLLHTFRRIYTQAKTPC